MEAVGFAASLIGIIQVTGKLASVTYNYLSGFKKAPKDITELVDELHTLGIVLRSLQDYAEKTPTSPTLQKLNEPNGPIPVFFKELKELHLKFNSIDTSSFSERLKWPLKEKDVAQYISKIERHKSLFKFALDADHISLSKAIEAYVVNIDLATEYIKARVGDTALAVQEIKADVKDTSLTVQEIKADVGDTNIAIRNLQSNQSAWIEQSNTAEDAETRAKVLDWLYSEPFETKHIETSGRRREGTGGWLLDSPEFCKLIKKNRESPILWGYGIPGAGKTFLSSAVIDYLQDKAQENKYGVAYIYFDYKEQKQQRPLQVLASLVKQLAAQTPQLPAYITDIHKKLTKEKRPTQQDLYSALVSTLKSFDQAFFVFDALDECNQNQQRKELLPLFHRIVQENNNASIFLTSRQYPEDIQVSFHDSAKIELRANDEDIKCYIKQKIDENPRAKRLVERGGSKDKIISELTKCANGMFLLVHFHIELICQQTTTKKITKELERLNLESSGTEGSPLDPTYDRAMRSIHTQAKSCIELATKIFTWLVKAQRTLTVDELRMAVSVEAEVYELEDDDLPDKATLLDVCAGLVTIDEKSNTVRLAHYTVQEYILRSSLIPEDADVDLAITCLTFLSFDIFAQGACISNKSLQSRIEAYPFLNYAVFKLPFHLKACDEIPTKESVLKFLENLDSITSYSQVRHCINGLHGRMRYKYMNYYDRYPKQLPLHVVSAIGHHIALQSLIEQGSDVLMCDSEGDTALHHAAKNGHKESVRLLLKNGADITTKAKYGGTALHQAAENGHTAVVQLLLENGADITTKDEYEDTALHKAAMFGHIAVVQLLIENGADITTKGEYGDTALHKAAENGHTAVVQLLIENGADITIKAKYGGTALHQAAENGHKAVVQLLIENGADITTKGEYGYTALHQAAIHRHKAVVQLLLENGADITTKGEYGYTALHKAAMFGHTAVVQLLIENSADISTRNNDQKAALGSAVDRVEWRVEELIQRIIDSRTGV